MKKGLLCMHVALAIALVLGFSSTNCEQLSTVFVLEAADSSSSASSSDMSPHSLSTGPEASASDSSNTRIITDESPAPVTSSNKMPKALIGSPKAAAHQQPVESGDYHDHNQHQQSQQDTNHQQQENHQHSNSQQAPHQHQDHTSHNHDQAEPAPSLSRRLEEEPQSPTSRIINNGNKPSHTRVASQPNQPTHKPKSTTTTTTGSSYQSEQGEVAPQQVPKTEERLLISITSEDDDQPVYSKPLKQLSSSGLLGSLQPQLESLLGNGQQQQQQQQQPHKRKPSITISIQDQNLKQNGGSGTPAVILRPSENGQSIVISTLGGSGATIQQPAVGGSLGANNNANSNINNNNNNNNNNHEPINMPVQMNPSPYGTSTHRPFVSGPGGERPVTSTLVEQPRPPQLALGINNNNQMRPEESYDSRPSTSRPQVLRPVNPPLDSYENPQRPTATGGYENVNNNNNEDSRPNNVNGIEGSKFPLNEKNCGILHETRIVGGEEADPADYMWMAAIIKSKPASQTGEARPFCGGSLITRRHILTAAHCLEGLAPRDVLVRLGSYDFDESASSMSEDYAIDQFRVPASYSKKTHVADIAIMRLKTPLSTTDNYKTVCMPQPRRSYVGALGTVTGYGSQSQTFRRASPKLRQVTVPVWENRKCSVVYKKNLTESFLCAGYEEGGKDACQGDSGGPLMTEGPNERMMVIGVVSHGIGCGSPGYPGVYTRTTTYTDWIEKNTRE